MYSFYLSMAYTPRDNPETVNGMVIRTGENVYLHAPVIKIDAENKEAFIQNIAVMAEKIWDHVEAQNKFEELGPEIEAE